MKTTIAALFLIASLTTKAQDFQAASLHLDMAGKQHQAATIAPLVTVAIAAMIYAGANGNEQATTAATMIGGAGLIVGVSLNISAGGHQRKAAKALILK